jgi:plasmid stability protein
MTRTRMTTRIPDHLQTALVARAEANHRSANAELIAILTQALSGTPETPTGRNKDKLERMAVQYAAGRLKPAPPPELTDAEAIKLVADYRGAYSLGIAATDFAAVEARMVACMTAAQDLVPYKAAIRRLIDDSQAMRNRFCDLDEAVKQAEVLL